MIVGTTFASVRVLNGCVVRWHPFSRAELTRWSDALSCHKLIDEGFIEIKSLFGFVQKLGTAPTTKHGMLGD
jgi:hypothetical protein